MDWQGSTGGAVTRQSGFNLGGLSIDNWMRIQEQNEKTISVIIGNPPYNANQQNENDNNKNREYPAIDSRIRETYIKESTAQKTKQYDMYKRFIRWASDRLADDGIIAFVSNRAYLDSRQDDGFREVVAQEFSHIYVLDLGSDVRRNPKISGTSHNVFGIQTGVAIGFLVRDNLRDESSTIRYARREDAEIATDKLSYLRVASLSDISFETVIPDRYNNWLNQSNSDFRSLMPLANRQTKLAKRVNREQAVFGLYSLGVITARDEWVHDFNKESLGRKVRAFISEYESNRMKYGRQVVDDGVLGTTIKWTRDLKRQLSVNAANSFYSNNVRKTFYRPFVGKFLYYSNNLNEMQYQIPQIFPRDRKENNRVICFCVNRKEFYVLSTERIVDYHFTGDTQCLPLYRYTDEGERVSNITQWGLRQFRGNYAEKGIGITAERVFAYTYAVLHDPVYREKYAVDLLREFPRLPLYDNFDLWADMGQELLDLHIGFERVEPFGLERRNANCEAGKARLRADKERGVITLDERTTLTGVPSEAWEYRLGSRSALEWVLDQYKEKKPRDPTIRERFNTYRFADHKEKVIDLLQRVCTVSVRTMEIVEKMERLAER